MSLRVFAVGLICAAGLAHAHGGATGIVKERMDGMLVLGKAMKALNAEAQADAPNLETVHKSGQEIVAQSGAKMVSRFPTGSLDKPTEASAEIWNQFDEFRQLADELEILGLELANASTITSTGLSAQLRALGENCKACHQDFRVKK